MNKQIKKESIFNNKTFLMVLSLIMAFLAWIFVSLDSNDTKGRTFTGISVDMEEAEDTISDLGLSVIAADVPRVSVRVEGVTYAIGNLDSSDIRIYPDVSQVDTAGTHTVPLLGEIADTNSGNVHIVEISPSSVQMKFDSLQTVSMDIRARLTGYSVPEDEYLIRDVTVTPRSVELTGPADELNRISQCIVEQEIDEELTSSYTTTLPLKFLDADGNEVDLTYTTTDITEAKVTLPILKKKEVPVTVSFINVPEGFPVNQLKFEFSNESIEVAGPESSIDQYREISLGQIDVRTLNLNSTFSFSVQLPAGFVNTENVQSVLVKLDSTGMVEKSFNIDNILVENIPLNYEVEVTTQQINNVRIIGTQSIVDGLVAGDIVATIDLGESSSIASGQIELPVKITIPNKGLVWASGNYRAIISIQQVAEEAVETSAGEMTQTE